MDSYLKQEGVARGLVHPNPQKADRRPRLGDGPEVVVFGVRAGWQQLGILPFGLRTLVLQGCAEVPGPLLGESLLPVPKERLELHIGHRAQLDHRQLLLGNRS